MRSILSDIQTATEPKSLIGGNLLVIAETGEPRGRHVVSCGAEKPAACWCIIERREYAENEGLPDYLENVELIKSSEFSEKFRAWIAAYPVAPKEKPTIVVDISSMSRRLMADLFEVIFDVGSAQDLSVGVIYSLAKFAPPSAVLPANGDICPVSQRFTGWSSNTELPTSLVVGLGYEQSKAEGACEFFDPNEVWVFSPRSPITEYDLEVDRNNEHLIERADSQLNCARYPVDDPARTFGHLLRTSLSLMSRSNPVLLPFGPKIFFVVCLFVAMLIDEVGVWIVTGDMSTESRSEPSEHLIGFTAALHSAPDPN